MNFMLGITVSVLSIAVCLYLFILYYSPQGYYSLQGVGWILGVLGFPATLLYFVVYWFKLSKSILSDIIWISFFYLLQYQLLAIYIYRLCKTNVISQKASFRISALLIIIILIVMVVYKIAFRPQL